MTAVSALTLVVLAGCTPSMEGEWVGTMTPPYGEVIAINYTVDTGDDGTMAIDLSHRYFGTFELWNVQMSGDTLGFAWAPVDVMMECKLARTEREAFEGYCKDESGQLGGMTMRRPDV
ncbi:MAG: hypothetical protein AAGJ10_05245 [Bacteroidota bacterium]